MKKNSHPDITFYDTIIFYKIEVTVNICQFEKHTE